MRTAHRNRLGGDIHELKLSEKLIGKHESA